MIVREEGKLGHEKLALPLDNILSSSKPKEQTELLNNQKPPSLSEKRTLTNLPTDRRYNQPLATLVVQRGQLEHHMILSNEIEERFATIESEFVARERLGEFGPEHRRKILLYGPPGCGKTLGAQRLAWNTGLPLLKVRVVSMLSSYLGECLV